MLRCRCDRTDRGRLCTLVSSLRSRSWGRRWPKVIASFPSLIGSVSHPLKVLFTTFHQTQILILDHSVSFGTHVVSDCYPICAKMRHILIEILQFGD
jgi:hypothetical protein